MVLNSYLIYLPPPATLPQMGDLTAATWLIAFGASINLLNASKNTPLDLGLEKDDTRLVDFLFSLGGEPGSLLRETGGEERWEENLDREDTGDGPGLAWQRRRDGRLQETGGQVKSGTCADSTPYIHKAGMFDSVDISYRT